MKRKFKIWLIFSFIFFLLSGGMYFYNKYDSDEEVLGESTNRIDYRGVPYISSIAPEWVYADNMYIYEIELSDIDTPYDQLKISMPEAPEWLYLEENVVKGVPRVLGTYRFVLEVSDGFYTSKQVNYILVKDYE